MKVALVAIASLLASCGSSSSSMDASGGSGGGTGGGGSGGSGGAGGARTAMCYADYPCYVSGQRFRCGGDGSHYQVYQEVTCEKVCGSPCSGGSCRLDDKVLACPEGRACEPSQDVRYSNEPCSLRIDAGVAALDAADVPVAVDAGVLDSSSTDGPGPVPSG